MSHNVWVERKIDEATRKILAHSSERTFVLIKRLLLKSELGARRNLHILDVGTGHGEILLSLADFAERLCGIDVSEEMLQEARKNASYKGIPNVEFKRAEMASIPYNNSQFDLLITSFTVHHEKDKQKVLDEFYRILKDKGILLLVDMMFDNLDVRDQIVDDKGLETLQMEAMERDVDEVSLKEFIAVLKNRNHIISPRYSILEEHPVLVGEIIQLMPSNQFCDIEICKIDGLPTFLQLIKAKVTKNERRHGSGHLC